MIRRRNIKKVVISLVQKSLVICLLVSLFFMSMSVLSKTNEDTVKAIVTAKVTTTTEEQEIPIRDARIIVINSVGEIIGTELTNAEGEAKIPVSVLKDRRFPSKTIGEVTIIAVANGYNEYINFSVPINEFNDRSGKVSVSLREINRNNRNEPQFLNGSFHRFTVFEMLDHFAEEIGLKRQEITFEIGKEAPWSAELKLTND